MRSSRRLWNIYASTHKQISIEARFLAYPENFPPQIPSAAHTFTNSNGMRAWVLSTGQWSDLQTRARDLTLRATRITTIEGTEAAVAAGNMEVGLLPQVEHGKFNVRVRAFWLMDSTSITITNFALTCRAIVPNGGALIVDGGKPAGPQATNYWFTLTPVAIDSKGNPKKL